MKPRFRYMTDTIRGTHTLEDCENRLNKADLRRLEDELRRSYNDLAAGPPGSEFRFQTELPGLERSYAVHKTGMNQRSPTIELHVGTALALAELVPPASDWTGEFLLLVRAVLTSGTATKSQELCLDYVRQELEELCGLEPERVVRLLLAGYLQLAAVSAGDLPDRPELKGIYTCASRVLREAMVEDATAGAAGEPESEGSSIFRRVLGSLMRSLGI